MKDLISGLFSRAVKETSSFSVLQEDRSNYNLYVYFIKFIF